MIRKRGILKMNIRLLALAIAPLSSLAFAQDHWVATWAASPQQPRVAAQPAPGAPPSKFENQTVRMVVHTSIGGHRARVQFSNACGTVPVTIGAAHIALRAKDSAIVP